LLGFVQQAPDVISKVFALADNPHSHAIAVQLSQIVANKTAQQHHKLANLRRRTCPVLCAEGEYCEELNTEVSGCAYRTAKRLHTPSMPFRTRQPPRRGPTSIAVHDDGDMPRHDDRIDMRSSQQLALGHSVATLKP